MSVLRTIPNILCAGLCVSVAFSPVVSLAATAPEPELVEGEAPGSGSEADTHAAAASEAYDARDYETAVREFEAAYAVDGDPSFLFNIGRVHEQAGDLGQAIEYYKRFVHEPGVELEHRSLANERIVALQEIIDTTEDEEAESSSPPPPLLPATQTDASPSQEPRANNGRGLIIAGSVVGGVGVLSLVAGGVFRALSQRDAERVDTAPDATRRRELEDSAIRNKTIGDATLITGGVLVAAAVPMLIVGLIRNKRSRSSESAWMITPRKSGAQLQVRF